MGALSGCHCLEEGTELGDPSAVPPSSCWAGWPGVSGVSDTLISQVLRHAGPPSHPGDLLGSALLWALCHLKYSIISGCPSPQSLQYFGSPSSWGL